MLETGAVNSDRMSSDTGAIYLAFCTVNGKSYVGQTWQPPRQRWAFHVAESHSRRLWTSKLSRAIRKHGRGAFVLAVLSQHLTQQELDAAEIYWINYFNAIQGGYNIKAGGRGGKHSAETRHLISQRRRDSVPTHCPKGHPYEGENYYVNTKGSKVCRVCSRKRRRMARAIRTDEEKQAAQVRVLAGLAIGHARERAKICCPKGHLYEGNNLAVYNGKRRCLTCAREAAAKYRKEQH